MAAEVGLAASVAGLLSLGIQLTSGITSFLDALENRQDELESARRQNVALTAALATIKTARFQNQQHNYAIIQSTQSCEAELRAVESLLAELANCDTSTWQKRLKNKKQKFSYAFDRKKVQLLVHRLQNANEILQLTISGLGL
ncbi:hypothetical protein PG999_004120 [Apiospora kogelbergensis]|uniref:Fungal N-terminal domain-containing protein n=1 Tax=Apiospora kogelbergensis TaxID=1337665 RepID=A0AAW0R5N9_9PEZI